MKERFTKKLILAVLDLDKKMRMEVDIDILDYVTEKVLSIEYEDKKWKHVAYLSKSLSKTERNYKIYNKDMLVVIRGLENWRHLLKSTNFKFEVWTDYKNL